MKIIVLALFFSLFAYKLHAFDAKNNASFVSEVKTGVTAHDVGFFGRKKEDGLDSDEDSNDTKFTADEEEEVYSAVLGSND